MVLTGPKYADLDWVSTSQGTVAFEMLDPGNSGERAIALSFGAVWPE